MAIAEHNPSAVSKKNRGVLKMSRSQLHDFAATKRKGLPAHAKAKRGTGSMYNFKQHLGGRRKK